jgi:hypothetical protein
VLCVKTGIHFEFTILTSPMRSIILFFSMSQRVSISMLTESHLITDWLTRCFDHLVSAGQIVAVAALGAVLSTEKATPHRAQAATDDCLDNAMIGVDNDSSGSSGDAVMGDDRVALAGAANVSSGASGTRWHILSVRSHIAPAVMSILRSQSMC